MTRHDRTGELVDEDATEVLPLFRDHDPRCRAGWLGEDDEGRIVPCLACRPHLVQQRRHLDVILRRGVAA
jgi:hypothetical protein